MLFRGSEFGIYSTTWLSVGVVFIAGNHDDILDPTNHHFLREHLEARQLLHDFIEEDPTVQCPANTWTTFRGLKIYGCPTVYLRQSHDVQTCADVSLCLTFSIMIINSRIQCRGSQSFGRCEPFSMAWVFIRFLRSLLLLPVHGSSDCFQECSGIICCLTFVHEATNVLQVACPILWSACILQQWHDPFKVAHINNQPESRFMPWRKWVLMRQNTRFSHGSSFEQSCHWFGLFFSRHHSHY
jgi:hypothetical protein